MRSGDNSLHPSARDHRGSLDQRSPFFSTCLDLSPDFLGGRAPSYGRGQRPRRPKRGLSSKGAAIARSLATAAVLAALFTLRANTALAQTTTTPETEPAATPTLKISEKVNAAASVDLGRQARPQAAAASWQGASLWLRYLLRNPSSPSPSSPASALSLRVEYFHDPDAAVSPASQNLWGTTLTFELRPHPQLILKLEGRYDRSTADAFGGRDGPLTKRDGFLFVLCAVATF